MERGRTCRQRNGVWNVLVEGSVVVWQFCILDICMFRGVAVACSAFVGCLGIGTHSGRLWSTQLRYQVSSVLGRSVCKTAYSNDAVAVMAINDGCLSCCR